MRSSYIESTVGLGGRCGKKMGDLLHADTSTIIEEEDVDAH